MIEITTPEQAIEAIAKASEFFGWTIAFSNSLSDEENIPGMIIGTEQYVNSIMDNLPDDTKV